MSFANVSDLLEHLNTSQPQAEQDDVPRKRHGEPACPVFDVPLRHSDDENCDQLNEMLVFACIIINQLSLFFCQTLFMVSVLNLVMIAVDVC